MDFIYKTFFSISGRFFAFFVSILYSVILINYLGIDLYAIYSIIYIIPLLVCSLGSLGLGPSIIYHIRRNSDSENRFMLLMSICMALLISFAYLIVLFFFSDELFEYLKKDEVMIEYEMMLVSWLIIPILILRKYLIAFLRGYYRIKQVVIIDSGIKPVLMLTIICAIYALDLNFYYVIALVIVVELVEVILVLFQLKDKFFGRIDFLSNFRKFKNVIVFGLKGHIGASLQKLNFDLIMLISIPFIENREIALIMLSLKILNFINLPIGGLINVLAPKISKTEVNRIKLIVPRAIRFSTLLLLLIIPFVWLFLSDLIVIFYGADFIGIEKSIRILIFGVSVLYVTNIMLTMLTYSGYPMYKTYARLFGLTSSILVFYFLKFLEIENFTSYSIASGYFFAVLITVYFLYKVLNIRVKELTIVNFSDLDYINNLINDRFKYDKTMEYIECPICKTKDSFNLTRIFSLNDSPACICKNCSLVYLNPRNSDSWYKSYYLNSKEREVDNQRREKIEIYEERQYKKANKIFEFINLNCSFGVNEMRVLEVGCTSGGILRYFKERGAKSVTGIDPEEEYVDYANSVTGIKVHKGYLSDLQNTFSKRFNVIIMRHVLERISDPLTNLNIARSLLTKEGLIFIETPSLYSMGIKEKWSKNFHREHPIIFSNETLKNALLKSKFKIIKSAEAGNRSHLRFLAVKSQEEIIVKKIRSWQVIVLYSLIYDLTVSLRKIYYGIRKKIHFFTTN